MQFSLKWMLVAVAYAAVACTSVVYSSVAWTAGLSLVGFSLLAAAVIGACLARGPFRGGCIGVVIAAVLFRGTACGSWQATDDVRRSLQAVAEWIVYQTPQRAATTAPQIIQTPDILFVDVAGTIEGAEIQGEFPVQRGGEIALGPLYGHVNVAGLTIKEAETAITKRLSGILRSPQVLVSMLAAAKPPANIADLGEQLVVHHFGLLFSLLGGLLGFLLSQQAAKPSAN